MIKNVTLGQYFPGNSPLHRLDPRIKLVMVVLMIVLVFLVKTYWGYLALLVIIAAGVIVSQIKLKFVLKSIKPILFVVIFTFILNLFFYKTGEVIFEWWILRATWEGLNKAVFLALRLIFLVASTALLTLTTSSIEFTDGIESLFSPLRKIKFPVHEMAMMMSIAIRFVPVLVEETDKIMSAQTARGAEFDSGNVFKRIRGMVPILVPLFVSAFRRADELAQAMESRCYTGGEGRTRLKQLKLGACDIAALIGFVTAGTLIAIYL